MKYTIKLPDDSVNISKENFLVEMSKLLIGLFLLITLIYLSLWLGVTLLVNNISPESEKELQNFFNNNINSYDDNRTEYLQSLVDDLNQCANIPYKTTISVSKNLEQNAFALLGARIVITTGMLNSVQNENELTFVLGHEMGHFKNKDHIRGLGNSLIVAFISMLINSDYTNIFTMSMNLISAEFSQSQEIDADWFAIEMLMCKYQDTVSATSLFNRMSEKDSANHFLSSHPDFNERVDIIKDKIEKKGFKTTSYTTSLKY